MVYDPRSVVSSGFPLDDFTFTYKISGTVVQADLGKALTLDPTAANTFKLAGDGDRVMGRLVTYEDRSQQGGGKTGAVQRRFKEKLPLKTGLAGFNVPVVGDTAVGAGAGEVKALNSGAAKTPDYSVNTIVEIGADYVVVELL